MQRRWFVGLLLLLLCQFAGPLWAEPELRIATRDAPPFAVRGDDGQWSGLSIELWRNAATTLGLRYRFEETSLSEMLASLEKGSVDAAVAALTVTAEREAKFDFSHPFLSSGLGIAVPASSAGDGWGTVTRFFSGDFLRVAGALLMVLLGVGLLVWLLERRRNPQFGGGPAQGIGSGLWWSAVTMTTVGYGDKAPITFIGRVVGLIWMFVAIIILTSFTAAFTTALTLGELGGKVRGVDDLKHARVATVRGSTSAQYLESKRLNARLEKDLNEALEALVAGKVDAVVYDAPILRYRARQDLSADIAVLPNVFERQDYAIGFPEGSALREKVNRGLLEFVHSPQWQNLLTSELGSAN